MQLINIERENMKDVIKEEQNYIAYIDEHVENVRVAYEKLFKGKDFILPLEVENVTKELYSKMDSERIINEVEGYIKCHDNSKYSDEEFYGYRRKYNATEAEKKEQDPYVLKQVDEEAEAAWRHHYIVNTHHPKFWAFCKIHERDGFGEPTDWTPQDSKLEIPEPMSMVSIIHMICDWEAMSMKFNGSTIDWYINKAKDERSYMHPYTRKIVEQMLEMVYNTTLPNKEELDKKDQEEGK